jgi:hypothetical protein
MRKRERVRKTDRVEPRTRPFRWQVAAIFAIALAVRLAHVWYVRSSPFFDTLLGDARGYDAWAQQIAGGDWIGQGVFYQAPLYPYFLGALYSIAGRDLFLVRICQAVIGAAGCAATCSWCGSVRRSSAPPGVHSSRWRAGASTPRGPG